MKRYLQLAALVAAAVFVAAGIAWPAEPSLLIDASTEFVDEPDEAAPAVLVTPCEVGPKNLPVVPPERTA